MRRSLVCWDEELQAQSIHSCHLFFFQQTFSEKSLTVTHMIKTLQYSWTGIPNIKNVYSYQSKYNMWVIKNAIWSSCSNTYNWLHNNKTPKQSHLSTCIWTNLLTLQLYLKEDWPEWTQADASHAQQRCAQKILSEEYYCEERETVK